MTTDRSVPHIIIMYVLIALLALLLIYTGMRVLSLSETARGEWQCSSAVCAQFVNPDEWVTNNCARSLLPDGGEYMACTIVIDGSETTVPLDSINLTFVAQQCAVAQCVQEINVRVANYTLPSTR